MKTLNDKFYGVLAAGTAAVLAPRPASAAAAGSGLDAIVTNLTDAFEPVAGFISILCYLGGAALVAQGLLKLKNHIDAPEKAPLKDALGRLLIGAGLIAIPFMISAAIQTLSGGEEGTVTRPALP